MSYQCHICGLCRLHKGWWVLSTSSISSQRTVPYFQTIENEPRPLGIHWAHRGLNDAKLGWEVKSWLLLMAGLWCLYFQIVNAHQGRLVGLTQFSSRHWLWCIARKTLFSVLLVSPCSMPLCCSLYTHTSWNNFLHGILIWVFASSIPEAGVFLQSLLMVPVHKHQENFRLRWVWHWGLFSLLSVSLLVGLGQCVARLCWLLSSYNQAKMHMSNIMFSFSLTRSSLFQNASVWEKCICLILILAYEMFAIRSLYLPVMLSECCSHGHFQLNSSNVLFVLKVFDSLSKFKKENFKCKKASKQTKKQMLIRFTFLKTLKLK